MDNPRISPEDALNHFSDGVLDMEVEGCSPNYIESFRLGFEGQSLLTLLLCQGTKQGYDDGKAARQYIDKLSEKV